MTCFRLVKLARHAAHVFFPEDNTSGKEEKAYTLIHDFRGLYSDLLEDWLSVESKEIVGGNYEKINPFVS